MGLPLKDSRIMRVSDLLALEGIAGVVSTIIVSDDRRFKTVGQADDDGDIHVTGRGCLYLDCYRGCDDRYLRRGVDELPGYAGCTANRHALVLKRVIRRQYWR